MAPPANAIDLVAARAPSATDYVVGPFTIKVPGTNKYIGRAEIETALYAPKPIIVRDTPYVWYVEPKLYTKPPFHYNLIAGNSPAGRWTAQGKKVYSFVAPVDGQDAATDLQLEYVGGSRKKGYTYYIKQSNQSVVGRPTSGAWYVHKTDEFAPVLAGTKGKATAFRFIPQPIPIEGPGGIARSEDEHLGPVQVDIL
ncbi:hypothetical protein OC834_001418 [Tilletia horrida]|uniref:Uncharacterized protein n=1 Tax=Tilletia horrida TaxID=155126 RepID=A0AAN6GHA9_9BASI|nr:hypothetical protein OC834_001418 [Tilletia horrida]KAK0539526.1 hypothetical protein OC842_000948 [Tilletia horrida]KAK0540048.1 hypothetical protein OC835_000846 [Tilletia horrida]KAK0565994.1 hypothetical protein OC844_000957 [Tilletia horrida]